MLTIFIIRKGEAVNISETSVSFYETTRRIALDIFTLAAVRR
jgi:hypothetical protein